MSHVHGFQRSPLLDDWFMPYAPQGPGAPGHAGLGPAGLDPAGLGQAGPSQGVTATTTTCPPGCPCCQSAMGVDEFDLQSLSPEVAEVVEQFLEDNNPNVLGTDPALQQQLQSMLQGLSQSDLQSIPGLENVNTDALDNQDFSNMSVDEMLAMIVEFLKDNPGVLDHAQQQSQPSLPPQQFAHSQPTTWPSQGSHGGGSHGGGGGGHVGHNHGGGGSSSATGGGSGPRPIGPTGTFDLENPGSINPADYNIPGGLQFNAARGAAVVRELGFDGTIGGLGERSGPSDHPHGNAIDVMTNDNMELGQQIADYFTAHRDELGVKYVIFNQTIWSESNGWQGRPMEDRGSPTANHMDHPHISFHGD